MTGLSDDQRANFNLMKSIEEYKSQDPVKRTNKLIKFSERLNSTKEIAEKMLGWNPNTNSSFQNNLMLITIIYTQKKTYHSMITKLGVA